MGTDVTGKGEGPNVGGGECVGRWTGVSHKNSTTLGAVAGGVDVNIVKANPVELEGVAHHCRYGWQGSSAGNEPVHRNGLLSDRHRSCCHWNKRHRSCCRWSWRHRRGRDRDHNDLSVFAVGTDVTGKGEGPNVGGGECVGGWTGVSHKKRTTLGTVAGGVDVNIVKATPVELEGVAHHCRYGW